MSTRDTLTALFETGGVPTGEDFAALVHAATDATTVSEVSTWTSPLGTSVSWIHAGKMFSFWSHGVTTGPLTLTDAWLPWATTADVPPLAAYQGEPMLELLNVEMDDQIAPVGYLQISDEGFHIRGIVGELTIPAGAKFIANKMLVLDVPDPA